VGVILEVDVTNSVIELRHVRQIDLQRYGQYSVVFDRGFPTQHQPVCSRPMRSWNSDLVTVPSTETITAARLSASQPQPSGIVCHPQSEKIITTSILALTERTSFSAHLPLTMVIHCASVSLPHWIYDAAVIDSLIYLLTCRFVEFQTSVWLLIMYSQCGMGVACRSIGRRRRRRQLEVGTVFNAAQ